jgi:septal ring factor EnvC (AmiA/AmiB activator)
MVIPGPDIDKLAKTLATRETEYLRGMCDHYKAQVADYKNRYTVAMSENATLRKKLKSATAENNEFRKQLAAAKDTRLRLRLQNAVLKNRLKAHGLPHEVTVNLPEKEES